jgi:UDP-glucuronate 4-epimerase
MAGEDADDDRPILVTGAAGFIGYSLAVRLLGEGRRVVGVDNFNDYYDPALKRARFARLEAMSGFEGHGVDLADSEAVRALFARVAPRRIVHLAAQAGVRYSLVNPHAYTAANVTGFVNILEGARAVEAAHLVYASTSSVYGLNAKTPYSESAPADHPLSLYAATKKANEAMAHAYAHLFAIPTTGLRFFTVYGPWGRPDMAPILFTRSILEGHPIALFNGGDMVRDFTFIDDIVDGVVRVLARPPRADPAWDATAPDPATSSAPWRIFNIGAGRPVHLMRFLDLLEQAAGKKAIVEAAPMQPGDVAGTHADVSALAAFSGYAPRTTIEEGAPRLVEWVRSYYRL